MSSDGPLLPSEPLDAADERLLATFDGIEKQQLDFFGLGAITLALAIALIITSA